MQALQYHGVAPGIARQLGDNERKLLLLQLDAESTRCPPTATAAEQWASKRRRQQMIRKAIGNRPAYPSKRQRLSTDPYAYYAAVSAAPVVPVSAPAEARRPAAAAAAAGGGMRSASPPPLPRQQPPRPSNLDIKHSAVPPSADRVRLKMSVHDLDRLGWQGARKAAASRSVNQLAQHARALSAQADAELANLRAVAESVAAVAVKDALYEARIPQIAAAAAAAAAAVDIDATNVDYSPFRPLLGGKRLMEWRGSDGMWQTTTEHALALRLHASPMDVVAYSPFFICFGAPFDDKHPEWLCGMQSRYGWCRATGGAPARRWSIRNVHEYLDYGISYDVTLEDVHRAGWIVFAA